MGFAHLWLILQKTYSAWDEHQAPRVGAALAFYTLLSLAPLAILVVAMVSAVLGHTTAQDDILAEVNALIGKDGADAVRAMIDHAPAPAAGTLASIAGLASLLFGASGVFNELRSVLNQIWNTVHPKGSGVWKTIKDRFFSFGMVLAVGFLLLVSLLLSAALAAAGKFFGGILPVPEIVLSVFNLAISLAGISLLFALIFRYVPEAPIRWRDVWVGAAATGFFFTLGKHLIGLYLGKFAVGSAYGAAGSLVVVIVWVYYSSMVFLFGAELTRVLETGSSSEPGCLGGRPVNIRMRSRAAMRRRVRYRDRRSSVSSAERPAVHWTGTIAGLCGCATAQECQVRGTIPQRRSGLEDQRWFPLSRGRRTLRQSHNR